jgi:predicted RNase H-like HicB family nuclease
MKVKDAIELIEKDGWQLVRMKGSHRQFHHTAIIERGTNSFGAYVPDLPGCIAVAGTETEVRQLIREAIEFHLEGIKAEGSTIPQPNSTSELIEVLM